ncbi:MAG: hypothetical protein ACTSV2_04515 [Candidatus Thorarchaeota archaeon]
MIRLIARVQLSTMESSVVYPEDEASEERIALLTGIVQLVSAALEHSGDHVSDVPLFMKSERGVIGYFTREDVLYLCQGDSESETDYALKTVIKNPEITGDKLASELGKSVKARGKEIGDLWR